MSFPSGSQSSDRTLQTSPDPQGQNSAALRLGQVQSLLGSLPGGNFGDAFGPSGPLASTYQLTPGEDFFRQGILGSSMPGATLGRAQGYVGPGGPLNSLFSLNPAAQSIYDQGLQGYKLLTDPSGGLFQNYLNKIAGPTVLNNATAMGMGRSGAALEALSNAGAGLALQGANLYPGLVSSGLNFARTPQTLQLQGLTGLGLPLTQQDQANLQTGYQAAGVPRTLTQQYGLQNQNLLYSMLTGLPFPTGTTQTGTGQIQQNQNVLSSVLAPMLSSGLLGLAASPAGSQAIVSGLGSLGSGIGSGIGSLGNLFSFGSSAPELLAGPALPESGGIISSILEGLGSFF